MAKRWERKGLRLYSRAMAPGFGQSEFAMLYKAARPALPDLHWFVGRLDSAFLLPPEWEGWPQRATPFAEVVRGLRPAGAHGVSDAANVLDRAALFVRDDANELYGFAQRPDWETVARQYGQHPTHPALLAGSTVAFLNKDAAYWACYGDEVVLAAAETALAATAGARVERTRFGSDLSDGDRRVLDQMDGAAT